MSILFADIVGFSAISRDMSPAELVRLLNDLYGRLDAICNKRDIEPIGTLGDCYYSVAGHYRPVADHAYRVVDAGLAMCHEIRKFRRANGDCLVNIRIGIHSGSVNSGIFGRIRFRFDVFSDDVNIARAMESTGKSGSVHISDVTYQLVRYQFTVEQGDDYELVQTDKPVLVMSTWFIQDEGTSDGDVVVMEAADKDSSSHSTLSAAAARAVSSVETTGKSNKPLENGSALSDKYLYGQLNDTA